MNEYVAGLYFDHLTPGRLAVALVNKRRPSWQAGKRNAIGGKVESGEDPRDAMAREFQEEAGITIPRERWTKFALLEGAWGLVHWYRAEVIIGDGVLSTMTDETVEWVHIDDLGSCLDNLPWLIAMAHPRDARDWPFKITERYSQPEPAKYHEGEVHRLRARIRFSAQLLRDASDGVNKGSLNLEDYVERVTQELRHLRQVVRDIPEFPERFDRLGPGTLKAAWEVWKEWDSKRKSGC